MAYTIYGMKKELPIRSVGRIAHQPGYVGQDWYSGVRQRQRMPNNFPASPRRRPPRKPANPVRTAMIIFLVAVLIGGSILAIGFFYYNTLYSLSQFQRPVGDQIGSTTLPPGRPWNILLLGSDNDGKYTFPAVLTQVMMIVHVDPTNNSMYLVSLPRDSWVPISDGSGMHKIDQAFFLGVQSTGRFEDGVLLARQTIENDYGIPIDRYGWVGLDGFAKVIDTLGGVDINVSHPIVDDIYPDDSGQSSNPQDPFAYRRLYLAPGPQHLDGQAALEYVRSRHADQVGDIGRTQRQQQVIQALKPKLNVPNIAQHFSELVADLKGKVYTDLSEQEMLSFANFARSLDANAIQRVTLGPGPEGQNYGDYANVYDPSIRANQDVVIPNCDTIEPLVDSIFGLGYYMHNCKVNSIW